MAKKLADYKREVSVLHDELKRKDEMIDKLRAENELLMRTAIKQRDESLKWESVVAGLKKEKVFKEKSEK